MSLKTLWVVQRPLEEVFKPYKFPQVTYSGRENLHSIICHLENYFWVLDSLCQRRALMQGDRYNSSQMEYLQVYICNAHQISKGCDLEIFKKKIRHICIILGFLIQRCTAITKIFIPQYPDIW